MRTAFVAVALCAATALAAPVVEKRSAQLPDLSSLLPTGALPTDSLPVGGLKERAATLPGLDPSALQGASITDILSDLQLIITNIAQVAKPKQVLKLTKALNTITSLTSALGGAKRDLTERALTGIDPAIINNLALPGLVSDLTAVVTALENALTAETQTLSTAVQSKLTSLITILTSVISAL